MPDYLLFATLCLLEVVLGLDNIFSFALLINQAPQNCRKFAKIIALSGAFVLRLGLLGLALAIQDTHYPVEIFGIHWSLKEAFLFCGGLFLVGKSLGEFRKEFRSAQGHAAPPALSMRWIIIEIIFIDMVFAIDSVLAAVAITQNASIIVGSIFSSIIFMYFAADFVIKYMQQSWRFNILGLFLILVIGLFLILKGLGHECDQKIVLSLILFGCVYEALMTSIEHARKKTHGLPPGTE